MGEARARGTYADRKANPKGTQNTSPRHFLRVRDIWRRLTKAGQGFTDDKGRDYEHDGTSIRRVRRG